MKMKILFSFIFIFNHALGSIGCMDNSWHLAQPFDSKEYHYVKCNCPCRKLGLARGECTECGHAHDFAPQYIIKRPNAPVREIPANRIPVHYY